MNHLHNRVSPLLAFILSAAILFLTASAAPAATIQISNSSAVIGGTGSFDIFCTGTAGETDDFFSFQFQIAAPPNITFTSGNIDTAAPYIFGSDQNPPFVQSLTPTSIEVADSDDPASQTINPGDAFGFAHIDYSVSPEAVPGPYGISFSSATVVVIAQDITFALPATLTVTVPEPATLSILALAATKLLTRRRRHG